MLDIKDAPYKTRVLVRSKVFRATRGFFVPALVGYKHAEAVRLETGWHFFTGVLGETTTEACNPVGWWPLPDDKKEGAL